MKPPTTTHFALLCLLSTGEASAYELVRMTGRSTGVLWPRSQSNLYADLKRLAADGLAEATPGATGRRSRTVYRITTAGRRELRRWLETPGATPYFECEALLKLGFAPSTTKAAALAQVEVVRAQAAERVEFGRRLATEYVDGDGPLPERLHINAVIFTYLWEQHRAAERWAEWAAAEIAAWPDTGDTPRQRERGLAFLRQAIGV